MEVIVWNKACMILVPLHKNVLVQAKQGETIAKFYRPANYQDRNPNLWKTKDWSFLQQTRMPVEAYSEPDTCADSSTILQDLV